jgi:hypothetical protein
LRKKGKKYLKMKFQQIGRRYWTAWSMIKIHGQYGTN